MFPPPPMIFGHGGALGSSRRPPNEFCGRTLPPGYLVMADPVHAMIRVRGPQGFEHTFPSHSLQARGEVAQKIQRLCIEHHRVTSESRQIAAEDNQTATHMKMLRQERDRAIQQAARCVLEGPSTLEKMMRLDPPEPDLDAMRPVEYLRRRFANWTRDVEIRR